MRIASEMTGDLVLPSRSVCLVAGIRLPCRTAKLEQTSWAAEAAAHLCVLCGSRSAPSGGVAGSGDWGRGQDSSASQPHLRLPSPRPCATVGAEPEITETWQVGDLRAPVGTPMDAGDRQVTVSVTASACGGGGADL